MSHEAITWAWTVAPKLPHAGARLTLVALADHASHHSDEEGVTCWPKIKRLAEMTGQSDSTVRENINLLVRVGLVEKVERKVYGTRAGPVVYRLVMSAPRPPVDRRSETADGSAMLTADVPAIMTADRPAIIPIPEPLQSEPTEGTSAPPALRCDGFDDWYARYPRKSGKAPARKTWSKMSPDDRAAAFAGLDSIERQAAAEGTEFLPYASTWLNQRRWEDEPWTPPTNTRRGNSVVETNAEVFARHSSGLGL